MRPLHLLITGADGQLGRELVRRGRAAGHQVLGCGREQLDLTRPDAAVPLLATSPSRDRIDAVINAAAYTQVDGAENDAERAFAVNRDGVRDLAAACAAADVALLHVSTDYVFDGAGSRPYREDDATAPLGVYGASKLAGEQALREVWRSRAREGRAVASAGYAIVRTSWVFGAHGNNFVKTMLRLGREREQLRVVADQLGCPTYAGFLADALLQLAVQMFRSDSVSGTYHYANSPATSWHGFAEAIFAEAGALTPLAVRELTPITTADYPTPAARPAYSVLDCRRIEQRCGIVPPPWREGLRQALTSIIDGRTSG